MENKLKEFQKVFGQDAENEEIVTDQMIISKNILKFSNTTIQLSSISQLNIGKIEMKVNTPMIAIFIFCASLLAVFFRLYLAIIPVLLSGLYIYKVYKNVPEDKIYLNLNLNSSRTYNIYFSDKEFAERVRTVIEQGFNGLVKGVQNIDMSEHKIYDISGDNNNIDSGNSSLLIDQSISNSGNNNSGNSLIGHNSNVTQKQKKFSTEVFDWDTITEDLNHVIESIRDDTSSIKIASEKALELSEKKDKDGFVKYILEHKNEFTSGVFQAVSSEALLLFIKQIF